MNQYKKYGFSIIMTLLLLFSVYRCSVNKAKYQAIIMNNRSIEVVDYDIIDSLIKVRQDTTIKKILFYEYLFDKEIFDETRIKYNND